MKKIHLASSSLMIMLCMLLIGITHAQQLSTNWSINVNGEFRVRKHMAVLPGTGHRYYITRQFDDGFNLVHLDQNGHEIWNLADRGSFKPHSLIYHGGKIFLLGFNAVIGGSTINAALRMYEDLGAAPRLVWEYEVNVKDRYTTGELIVADPAGDGVIFASISSTPIATTEILKTRRISASREVVNYDDINLGTYAFGANPSANGMCADAAGNVYVTGLSDPVRRSMSESYVNPCSQFIVKFNRTGRVEWTSPVTEAGYNRFGFDIDVDATSVYVLGQRVREHADAPTPWTTGETTLTKLNAVTGAIVRSVALPSRLRSNNLYSIRRKSLLIDHAAGTLFVAYDGSELANVTVKALNTSLDEQWTHNIPLLRGAHYTSMISPGTGRLAVAVNDRPDGATLFVITSLTYDNEQFDRYESSIGGILDMQVDATGLIHIGGMKREIIDYVGYFEQVLRYRSNYRISPIGVHATPYVLLEVLRSQNSLNGWSSAGFNWNCSTIPCTRSFMASMSGAGAQWKEVIAKPSTISLPQDDKFNTFRFSIEKKTVYNVLYEVDRTLIDNGVTALSLETDSNYGTLAVSSATAGANFPLTLSLIGSNGKIIGELKTVAPGKKVFSNRVSEPVSYIRITAPPVKANVHLYPNPSNGKFTVSIDKSVAFPVQLAVHDGQGTKVHQQSLYASDTQVVLSNARPGLYVVRITGGKLDVTKTMQVK